MSKRETQTVGLMLTLAGLSLVFPEFFGIFTAGIALIAAGAFTMFSTRR